MESVARFPCHGDANQQNYLTASPNGTIEILRWKDHFIDVKPIAAI